MKEIAHNGYNKMADSNFLITAPCCSRQHDIPQNLPIAVGLALPDGEKTAAIDRQSAVFKQPDFPISRFIGEVTVDDEFLRVNFRRACRTRACKSIAVHLLNFR